MMLNLAHLNPLAVQFDLRVLAADISKNRRELKSFMPEINMHLHDGAVRVISTEISSSIHSIRLGLDQLWKLAIHPDRAFKE